MKRRILTVGSICMDFLIRLLKLPDEGEVTAEEEYQFIPGGKGLNAAVTLAQLGADSILCTKLGSDINGTKLRNFCDNACIDNRFITVGRNVSTGMKVLISEETGTERIIKYCGANEKLTPQDVEDAFTCYPDAALLQFDIPAQAVLAASEYAEEQGIPVFVDAGPTNPELDLSQIRNIEVFSPNADETFAYSGIYPSDVEKCMKACITIEQRINAKYIVLKLGAKGCFLFDGKYYKLFPAHDVECVDKSAAGDAFTAALAFDYMNYGDIKRACEYANIVGALAVSKTGAAASAPTKKDIENFVKSNKINFKL